MFFKRDAKPSYNVYLHARDQERVGIAPPPTMMKSQAPDWWKTCDWNVDEKQFQHRFGNVYDPQFWAGFSSKDKHEINFPTAKGCPALADYMSTGYVFKLWSDLFIYAKDGNVHASFKDESTSISEWNTIFKEAEQSKLHIVAGDFNSRSTLNHQYKKNIEICEREKKCKAITENLLKHIS